MGVTTPWHSRWVPLQWLLHQSMYNYLVTGPWIPWGGRTTGIAVMCHLLEKRNTSLLLPAVLDHLQCYKIRAGEGEGGWYAPLKWYRAPPPQGQLHTCTPTLASFPGRLPLRFLDHICDLWTWRRPGTTPASSTTRWTWSWCSADSVSVIMATCHELTVATTGGTRYESPRCTVVVGSYSGFVPSAWHAQLRVFQRNCMPYHRITVQQVSQVPSSVLWL